MQAKRGSRLSRAKLSTFVKHTLAQKYNGKSAPKVFLFSPLPVEDLHDPNLPDPSATNARLKLYAVAMREVAVANRVGFVDLFSMSHGMYDRPDKEPRTINGVHLNEHGNLNVARLIDLALFSRSVLPATPAKLEQIRQAVLAKNFLWFNRYRTVDGYSIFGGRADLSFVGGQTNRVVAAREMEILDVMTANRDQAIWATAQGKPYTVDDSNTPAFLPVTTNKPGAGPNGEHLFLGGEEAIAQMTVGKNLKVNLFASEETFPALVKPVQMSFDTKGRLWVACWESYPHWKPKEAMDDKILILEDTDGDGKADKQTVFADKLHCPTGFEFASGGIYVAHQPDIMFLKDSDGDDKADIRERVLSGLDSADTHHAANSFQLDPGGALYFQEGTFHQTQVETPWGPTVRNSNAGVYRYEPRTRKFEVYVSYGFANPHGHAFDRWGQDVIVDGTGANPYHGTLFSGRMVYPDKHETPPQVYQQRTRPCAGVENLSSGHFPEDFQGNLLVANVIGFQGILRYKLEDKDASIVGTELEPIVSSRDPNFRPSDIEVGPDGAIYFLDWQNPIIGHMQHNLRDPSRDRKHGRVYRVTHEGRPLSKPANIAGAPVDSLLDLLKSPEDRVRSRVKIELGNRDSAAVIPAVKAWASRLDKSDPAYEHQLTEALWVHQYHNAVDLDLLTRVLGANDFHARAAGTRILCVFRDRVPDALDRLKKLASDAYPRVRLEAVRAASFFEVPEAVEIPLISAESPTDPSLDYLRGETMKTLEPVWRKAVAEGKTIAFTSEAGARFFLGRINTDELLKMNRSRSIDLELLRRTNVREAIRADALADLARLDHKTEVATLIEAIQNLDGERDDKNHDAAVFDLALLLTARSPAELTGLRPDLEHLARSSKHPVTRQVGFLALIAADGGFERAWTLASTTAASLRDFVEAIPLIRDPGQRSALYPRVLPLLDGLPNALAGPSKKATVGRYVRIEMKGRQTLTLAEVEVFSEGRNVAPAGKASQVNTAYGGPAGRGIDGNKSGAYGDGGQSHTEEETLDPWWEVDLFEEMPIDSIHIYTRTEGGYYKRLDHYNLKVLDAQRQAVVEVDNQPSFPVMAAFELGGSSLESSTRRAAMAALTSVRGKEADTFRAVARFARQPGSDRSAAIRTLLRIPSQDWPTDEAAPLLASVLAYLKTLPAADRTSPNALEALQLGDALASLLPPDQARLARRELGALGVRMIRLGTLTDQMLFNKDRIAAQAGKAVEVVFENGDIMPHNFVITKPGALEEVGLLGESTATSADAISRQYVPASPKILVASRLLNPRESQKIAFTAPSQPGIYPYVCTYPGHWRRMYGAFYVVADIDAYLADPSGYLASHPMPILDTLLKDNRPRKEWTYDDLSQSVEVPDQRRSFANGKQIFEVASCVSCHKLNGVGVQFGPNLAELDGKMTRSEILRSLVEPSHKIDDKYATNVFALKSGKVVSGMILEETANTIKVIENPLAKVDLLVINKSEVEDRSRSATSIMPKGLLDKLTREEILDLVAYLVARGDGKNPLFQGLHPHGH